MSRDSTGTRMNESGNLIQEFNDKIRSFLSTSISSIVYSDCEFLFQTGCHVINDFSIKFFTEHI